ncbi:MAG TPA: hypothetical protein EYN70_01495, partial [Planctomycetaceae bacterium]|nr:hypothetical protein [Planctomycetaceae bacterium]
MRALIAAVCFGSFTAGLMNDVALQADEKLPAGIVDAERVEAATELVFTEGPAFHRDGSVYFT